MSTVQHFMPNFNDNQKCIGPKQQQHNDNISCVYNSQSPASKTILITNNYSQVPKQNTTINNNNNPNLNNSSITIYTHNSDAASESTATNKQPTSPRSTVVLDRINILINNHYNETIPDNTIPSDDSIMAINGNNCNAIPNSSNCQSNQSITFKTIDEKKEILPINEFSIGQDVLVKQNDDRYYLGTIISMSNTECLIKFDDNTELWSIFSQLTKLNCTDRTPICVVCKQIDELDTVEVCQRCQRGYHIKCRNQGSIVNGIWYCKKCTTQNGTKSKYDYNVANSMVKRKSSLSFNYDINSLSWDKRHRVNKEQKYCYCGKNGVWYMKMISCARCRQWFHENCVKCLVYPLLYGDCFYVFVCSICNHGREFMQRVFMKLDDVIQLILFNLSLLHGRDYFNINTIIPYAQSNWEALQLGKNLRKLTNTDVKTKIIRSLSTHKTRFKSRDGKKDIEFSLQCQQPPFVPNILMPPGSSISDLYARTFCYENYRLHTMPKSVQTMRNKSDTKKNNTLLSYEKDKDGSENESILSELCEPSEFDSENEISPNYIDASTYGKNAVKKSDSLPPTPPTSSLSRPSTPNINHNHNNNSNNNNGSSSNDFYADSDRSRDIYDFDEKNMPARKLNRKRSKAGYKTPIELVDLCESSDDTSSRSTLNLIIPPPKNFQGFNNPFLSPTKLRKDSVDGNGSGVNGINQQQNTINTTAQPLSIFGRTNLLPNVGNFRVVRTVKRRLSVKDIMIGPNMEVKRRKIRRRSSGNVEVISTATIHTLSKYASYLPIRNDTKEFPLTSTAAIRSTLNTTVSSSASTTPIASTSVSPQESNAISTPLKNTLSGGRRLRKRRVKNYAENIRKNSTSTNQSNNLIPSTMSSASTFASITLNAVPLVAQHSSPLNNSIEASMNELQSSLTAYFGASNRIENGEPFRVRGKRIGIDGRNQYLIEWEDLS